MIGSYCILCILIYFVNLFLLWYAWLIRRRFASGRFIRNFLDDLRFFRQQKRIFLPGFAVFSVAVILVIVLLPPYWRLAPEPLSREMAYGLTAQGHPWFGAENPEIEIEMYSDYQCFQCKKMHVYLRKLIAGQPQKIRVIHRHYPMDHEVNYIVKEPFHIGSGKMALIAIYAASKGKFWEMNDLLFEIGGRQKQIDLNRVAQKTGLETVDLVRALEAPVIRNKLSRDVWRGMKLRILGTPSFVIDGKIYAGNIPADVLQKYLK
jgi:protein-disulfide isomerase